MHLVRITLFRLTTVLNRLCPPTDNIYIADSTNNCIRKVTAATGIITTIAGIGGASYGYSGDNGPATSAKLFSPHDVSLDSTGNVYIADRLNNCIRKVTVSTDIISTIAGTGASSYSGDGGAATAAELYNPIGVAVDAAGIIKSFCAFMNN